MFRMGWQFNWQSRSSFQLRCTTQQIQRTSLSENYSIHPDIHSESRCHQHSGHRRFKIGNLHAALPAMIQEVEAVQRCMEVVPGIVKKSLQEWSCPEFTFLDDKLSFHRVWFFSVCISFLKFPSMEDVLTNSASFTYIIPKTGPTMASHVRVLSWLSFLIVKTN